jgi:hypothetical protein
LFEQCAPSLPLSQTNHKVYTPNREPKQLARTVWLIDAEKLKKISKKTSKKPVNFCCDLLARTLLKEIPEDLR